MYGSENWVLTDKSIVQLEYFLGEMAKRALKWPRISQIQQLLVAMSMETIQCSLLIRKLCLLKRHLRHDADGIGALTVRSLIGG